MLTSAQVLGVVPDYGPQPHQLLQRGQEVRHLVLAPELVSPIVHGLADLRRVFLGEAAGLVEQIAPPLRGHAGSLEDGERPGDGRAQGRLITELPSEIFEEGPQSLPVLAASRRASPAWPSGALAPARDEILQARWTGGGSAIGRAWKPCKRSRLVQRGSVVGCLRRRIRSLPRSFNLVMRPFEVRKIKICFSY